MRHRDVTETSPWTGRCKKGEERTHGIVWSAIPVAKEATAQLHPR